MWNRKRDPTVYCIPRRTFNGKETSNWKKVKKIQKEIEKKDAARKKADYILLHGVKRKGKLQDKSNKKK